jgi:hypothetical protein
MKSLGLSLDINEILGQDGQNPDSFEYFPA